MLRTVLRRRTVLDVIRIGFVLCAAWVAYTQTAETTAGKLNVQQISQHLYVIEGTSNGSNDAGNVAVYVTGEGVIMVDDRFEQDYRQVVAAVKSITGEPIRYIINTHHHGDHTGSNAQFLASTEVIAHSNARKHMVEGKMPGPPRIVFNKETSIFLGGKEVRAIYYGRGHTDGDVAVYFPFERAVHLGDLMAGTRGVTNPVVDYVSGGHLRDWPATLDGVLQLEINTVIPGHGAVTNRDGLVAHRNKIAAICDRLTKLTRDGKSKDAISQDLVATFDFKPINMGGLDGMIAEMEK
jgi:cyclase